MSRAEKKKKWTPGICEMVGWENNWFTFGTMTVVSITKSGRIRCKYDPLSETEKGVLLTRESDTSFIRWTGKGEYIRVSPLEENQTTK